MPGAGIQAHLKCPAKLRPFLLEAFCCDATMLGQVLAWHPLCRFPPASSALFHTAVADVISGVLMRRDEGQARVAELQQLGSEAEGRARERAEATQHLAYYLAKLEETQGKVGHRGR